MNSIPDFEDMLARLNRHAVKYLIVGGLAFIYHAKSRRSVRKRAINSRV